MSRQITDASPKVRIHPPYYTQDGKKVPGVTTVIGDVLSKPALVPWAWKMGKAGIELDAYVDDLAGVGTLAHRMILCHLKGEKTETAEYSAEQIDKAENCFLKYLEWERQRKVEPVRLETPMVSEEYGFGGTPDFVGFIDGAMTLMDFKTGKGIYPDYWIQLGGYWILTVEQDIGHAIENFRILNIGRDESEKFVEEQRSNVLREESIFLHALAIYKLKRER
jgi:hypothetical protein